MASPNSLSIYEDESFTIHTALLFSSPYRMFLQNISLVISRTSGLILKTYSRASASAPDPLPPSDIDLTHLTILPGLVDAHTHIFLHAYSEVSATHQMLHESPVERILRASNHARAALDAGFTTYRDLGTEGMATADISLRDAINRGITPGPRLFIATDPITTSSSYTIANENPTLHVPRLADEADGTSALRAAVRRRLGAGADIIKIYADQESRAGRYPEPSFPGALPMRFPPLWGDVPQHITLFTAEEMAAVVDEAHAAHCPVAAHASSPKAVIRAARAGVDTIEHGQEPSAEAISAMRKAGCIFVPTLSVMEYEVPADVLPRMYAHTYAAWKDGVKIACGGDTGPVPHGQNVRELELLLGAGVPLADVLAAATVRGWEACGGEWCGRRFGVLQEGWAADIVGLEGDVREDASALRRVAFVMKDGEVWKRDGRRVG
ncbi:isoaspartyl dipeptidase-like protein [Pseudovirgaria hyperparasitica]|uniref:Isoaspartyl dipeptidase-like protein n=1 Tax=Pseudovirgaria hyperparasitica TaxID=470096 RepID=A0A6A6W1W6_9PEZI|nr:isoaspartyl dipeptidase-like protein [Pseudovirgaria hyperparasitica]KAF2755567.1 isoaspartyl dipeptidase-like protein [Pseudovirgaria hyperparasitica]